MLKWLKRKALKLLARVFNIEVDFVDDAVTMAFNNGLKVSVPSEVLI